MLLLRFLLRLFRFTINVTAFIAFFVLLFISLGTLYTYISWASAEGYLEWLVPFVGLALVTYPIARWYFRSDLAVTIPKSETAQIWLRDRVRPSRLPGPAFCVAIAVASVGLVGHAIPSVREFAVFTLRPFGTSAYSLLRHLADRDDPVEENAAVRALCRFAPDTPEVAIYLFEHGGSDSVEKVLTHLRIPCPEKIADSIRPGKAGVLAAKIAAGSPPDDKSIPELIENLSSSDVDVQGHVTRCLVKMGPRVAPHTRELVNLACSVRRGANNANEVLESVGPALGEYAGRIVALMKNSKSPGFYTSTVVACGEPAIALLLPLTMQPSDNWKLEDAAIDALVRLLPVAGQRHAEEIRTMLRDRFAQREGNGRLAAAASLLRIGDRTADAVGELANAARSPLSSGRRSIAIRFLRDLGPLAAPMVPTYREMLTSGQPDHVSFVMYVFPGLGEAAVPLLPEILEQLRAEKVEAAQVSILLAIGSMGPAVVAADQPIREMMDELKFNAQLEAAVTRCFITSSGKPLADFIAKGTIQAAGGAINFQSNHDALLRVAQKLGPNARDLIPVVDRLEDDGLMPRSNAIRCIELIDPMEAERRDPDRWWRVVFGILFGCLLLKAGMMLIDRKRGRQAQVERIAAIKQLENPFVNADENEQSPGASEG